MSGPFRAKSLNINPTTNSGIVVLNAQMWSGETQSRTGDIYGRLHPAERGKIYTVEPVFTLSSAGKEEITDPNNGTRALVFSTLNGINRPGESFNAIRLRVRFVGFARNEPMHQGMAGRINGSLAVHIGGLLTTYHTGDKPVPTMGECRMTLPNPARYAQEWRDRDSHRVLGKIVPYNPLSDRASRENAFLAAMRMLHGKFDKDAYNADSDAQASQQMLDALAFLQFVAIVEYKQMENPEKPMTNNDVVQIAENTGVVSSEDPRIAHVAAHFQQRCLERGFLMTAEGGQTYRDERQLYFPHRTSHVNGIEAQQNILASKQGGAIENLINGAINCEWRKRDEVFGFAPHGGNPGEPMDICMRK